MQGKLAAFHERWLQSDGPSDPPSGSFGLGKGLYLLVYTLKQPRRRCVWQWPETGFDEVPDNVPD
jgi:hypothetical protein